MIIGENLARQKKMTSRHSSSSFEKNIKILDFSSKCKSSMAVIYTKMQRYDHLSNDSANSM